jgi:hypothetical protein
MQVVVRSCLSGPSSPAERALRRQTGPLCSKIETLFKVEHGSLLVQQQQQLSATQPPLQTGALPSSQASLRFGMSAKMVPKKNRQRKGLSVQQQQPDLCLPARTLQGVDSISDAR